MRPWFLPSAAFTPRRHSLGGPGPWSGHLPFACDLLAALRPSLLVELGTFYGESYFGFCQALEENAIRCQCYSIDTWQGDQHGGHYGDEIHADVEAYNRRHYAAFSHLLRMSFDAALPSFASESIDVLHIDGYHTYEAVSHDFNGWLPKVRPGGVVLLHDTAIRSAGFGVWRFWRELLAHFPGFEFTHSAGLGVLQKLAPVQAKNEAPAFLASLFQADATERTGVLRYYETCAERLHLRFANAELHERAVQPFQCGLQIFSSSAQSHVEENSASRVIQAGSWQEVVFELPAGLGPHPLRIDPADRPCLVEMNRITIAVEDEDRPILWSWNADQPAPALRTEGTARLLDTAGAITLLSDGIDPELFFPDVCGPEFERPLRVELGIRITPYVERNGQCVPLGALDPGRVSSPAIP